ncbi:MAG TPA: class I SAM-dependent methyltransferase [Candidatus Paceibacterota bacterium]|nr:class I SAM-dependent methyltransferase [Candidatus Paceibacterota bacterium]
MKTGNQPYELFRKHAQELDLVEPLFIESDADIFRPAFSAAGAAAQSAVVFLPKSKGLIDMTLALVSGMVAENGLIVLAGANDAGIRSAKDLYEKNIGPVDRKIVGNHSALYVGRNKRLGAGKTWRDFLKFFSLSYKNLTLDIANIPGVFSAGELDEGTKLLLDNIPYDKASILDIGCGAGIIGAVYKETNPTADVTMSDTSMIAVHASEETRKKNGLAAQVVHSDAFESIEGRFDLIVSNPPFHSGIETNYSFIERFAAGAKKHLKPGGECYIVANSFLAYEGTLEKYIGPTETIADDGKFKVLRSRV